jgi:hypothetical protein
MNNQQGYLVIALVTALSVFSGMPVFSDGLTGVQTAIAEDDWLKEFEDICSQTQGPSSFTPEELKGLIGRCDALKPSIEKLDDTRKKVYLKRLEMCREFLSYTLESKAGK